MNSKKDKEYPMSRGGQNTNKHAQKTIANSMGENTIDKLVSLTVIYLREVLSGRLERILSYTIFTSTVEYVRQKLFISDVLLSRKIARFAIDEITASSKSNVKPTLSIDSICSYLWKVAYRETDAKDIYNMALEYIETVDPSKHNVASKSCARVATTSFIGARQSYIARKKNKANGYNTVTYSKDSQQKPVKYILPKKESDSPKNKTKKEFAEDMLKNPTASEYRFYKILEKNFKEYDFEYQVVTLGFIPDVYFKELKLIFEVDGGIHESADQASYDEKRDNIFLEYGITTVRFTDDFVMDREDLVVIAIRNNLQLQHSKLNLPLKRVKLLV